MYTLLAYLLTAAVLAQPANDSASSSPDSLAPDSTGMPWQLVTDGSVTVSGRMLPRRTTKQLTVGDRFAVEYTVRRHREHRVSPLLTPSTDQFTILNQNKVTRYQGDTVLEVYRLEMACFATGTVKLPPMLVTWTSGGSVWAAQSDSLPVEITSVLPEKMTDINELKPQVAVPNLLPLVVAGSCLLAAGLGYLGWRLWRRLRRQQDRVLPPVPAWDEALAALAALPVEEWVEKGLVKRLYYSLSEIIKRYLTRRFGFAAIDQTTTEIVRELKLTKAPARDRFAEFLYSADMVKYAKHQPPNPKLAVETAVSLVKETIPAPEIPLEAADVQRKT